MIKKSFQSALLYLFIVAVKLFSTPIEVQAYEYITCQYFPVCGPGCRGLPCAESVNHSNDYNATLGVVNVQHENGAPETKVRPLHNPMCTGDPVYLHSGQFYYQCNDLSVPGRKLDVDLGHTYFSGMDFNGQFGYGWMFNYYMRLHKVVGGDAVIVSGDGRKTRYVLSGGTTYTAPAGRFETLVKNGNNTWTLTLAQGQKYQFDTGGKLAAIEDKNGNTITFVYEPSPQPHQGYSAYSHDPLAKITIGMDYRLSAITDTAGRTFNFIYNADGLLDKIVDNGREVVFTYDPNSHDLLIVKKPATTQFPAGVTKTFLYDATHNVVQVKDAKNQMFVDNHYDAQGRVYEQELGGHSIFLDYSVANKVTETDRNGTDITYTFDANGLMTEKKVFTKGLRPGEPASFTTTYTYNSDSLKLTEKLPKGNGIKYTYDSSNSNRRARGNLLEIRRKTNMTTADNDTNDIVTDMTYESQFNQIKSISDPNGNYTLFVYDYDLPTNDPKYGTLGDLIKIQHPAVAAGTPVTEFDYNDDGQPIEIIDPNGNVTQYTYNGTGYLESIVQDPAPGINAVTQFTYDTFGNLDQVTDANNHVTEYDYDELGWLNQMTNPLGFVTKHTHDANGNVIKTERQADTGNPITWQTTEFTYDILNNLKTVKDPLNRITTYNYDNNENLASVVDAENNTTTNVYDERDLLFTVTDANTPTGVTRYDYDINGNLAKITDAETNETVYAYDLFDRLNTTTYEDSTFSDFDYDKNSNLTRHTTPSIKPIDYAYDALNRLVTKTFPLTPTLNTTYSYDPGSRLTSASNAASAMSFTYDALNHVLTNTQTLSSTPYALSYQYDDKGNRTQLIYPSTKTLDYVYDVNDRLDVIKQGGVDFVDYDYDPLDRRIRKSYLDSARPIATYDYDIANQLESVTNKLVNNTAISVYAYPGYDNVGNRLQLDRTYQTNPTQNIDYAYNDIYELTTVTGSQSNSYAYDNVGNRTTADSVSYTPNNLNQYSLVGATSYSYDGNGNLTDSGANTYTYDEQNRLASLDASGSSNDTTYEYDAFNRRVKKNVNGTIMYFLYDGDQIIAEYASNGSLIAEYVAGDQIDEVLSMERNSNTYFYHYDGLGSVTEVTNAAGSISENYTYDAFGAPSVSMSSIGNPYRFTGLRFDEESGLQDNRARVYSSELGRFLQRDPIDYEDSLNLYQYTYNNPVNFTDPTGEFAIPGAILGALGGIAGDVGFQVAGNLLSGKSAFENINYQSIAASGAIGAAAGATGYGIFTQGGKALKALKEVNRAQKALRARQVAMQAGKVRNAEKTAIEAIKRNKALQEAGEAFLKGTLFPAFKRIYGKLFLDENTEEPEICK